jgi:hypothetical protein
MRHARLRRCAPGLLGSRRSLFSADKPDLLVKLFGQREELIPTLNPQGGMSNTPHAIPLIRPEDIGRLSKGEAISIHRALPDAD